MKYLLGFTLYADFAEVNCILSACQIINFQPVLYPGLVNPLGTQAAVWGGQAPSLAR